MAASISSPLIGKVLGKYRIVEKLASGAMADVFKGIQIGLDREVAVKVLPAALAQDREMRARFRRESQATAKLSHPNIITIYDSGEQEGTFFYVMEFLKSDSLEDVLEHERPLSLPRATKLGSDILKALVYCHEKGVCHGDLKAAHVKFDMRENAVLTDFAYEPDAAPADPRADLARAAAIVAAALAGAETPGDVAAWLARPHETAKDMLAELKKIELRIKAKLVSKPTQPVRAPGAIPDSSAAPSALEPSAVAPAPGTARVMLATAVPVFLLGVAVTVWALRPAEPPPVVVVPPSPVVAKLEPPPSPPPEEPPYEPPPEPSPPPGGSLAQLTRGYLDKVSRMTPDERSKLLDSLRKFTDIPEPLTPMQKADLIARPTNPKDDSDFNTRLRMSRRWMVDLALARKDVTAWEPLPAQIQKQTYLNPLAAARRLDRFLKDMAEAEKR